MKEITIANEKMLGKTIFDTACDDILQTEQTKPGKRVASGSKFVSTKRRQALTADRRTSFDSTCLSTAGAERARLMRPRTARQVDVNVNRIVHLQ
jgi:hypothetical protein